MAHWRDTYQRPVPHGPLMAWTDDQLAREITLLESRTGVMDRMRLDAIRDEQRRRAGAPRLVPADLVALVDSLMEDDAEYIASARAKNERMETRESERLVRHAMRIVRRAMRQVAA